MQHKELEVRRQVPLEVRFRHIIVGEFFADVLVENKVLVELKAVKGFTSEHFAQIINYLKATGIEVGLIVNFGNPKLEFRRFNNRFIEDKSLKDFLK